MIQARRKTVRTLLIATALAAVSTTAAAQWMWKDEAGHVVASDQPPPMNVPQSHIIKQPRPRTNAAPPPAATQPTAATAGKADATKSLADRELESKQHQKEAADAAKKADEEAARAKAMKDNCAAVRGNLAALQSGGRASRFNEKGEKVYIDDADRQGEINKQQAQIAEYCKS